MTGHGRIKIEVARGPVWSGEAMKLYINMGNLKPEQIQPNGIDLTADKILVPIGGSVLSEIKENCVRKCELEETPPIEYAGIANKGWFLNAGYYVVEWTEVIKIPPDAVGLLSPRSTLLRLGGTICGAVWDRGYHGKGRSGLILYNHLLFERGTRLAQMIFIDASGVGKTYDGQYQHEQLNQDDKNNDI